MSDEAANLVGAALLMAGVLAVSWMVARRSAFYRENLGVTQSRELALDGLRGIAALMVMAHHASMYRHWYETGYWGNAGSLILQSFGPGGVLFFFMLTGYLFWGKARSSGGKFKIWSLWRGRVRRIAPLYLFSVAVVLGIAFAKAGARVFSQENWQGLLRLLALGGALWNPVAGLPVSRFNASVAWTLWYEWRFYFILPFVAWFAIGWRVLWVAAVTGLLYWQFPAVSDLWLVFNLGMVCAVLLDNPETRKSLCHPAMAPVALVAAFLFSYCIRDFLIASICFAGALFPVFLAVAAGNTFWGFLVHSATRCLGAISYSVYLLHGIVLYLGLNALKAFGPAHLSAIAYWSFVIFIGLLAALICAATYRWIESPFLSKPAPAR